jgi:hypothetical protein
MRGNLLCPDRELLAPYPLTREYTRSIATIFHSRNPSIRVAIRKHAKGIHLFYQLLAGNELRFPHS